MPRIVDLFCGAGGLSLGFDHAGFQVVSAYDHWQPAVDTYLANFQHPVERIEIGNDLVTPNCEVILGGPPCQGFSSAGLRRADDARNSLVRTFANIVVKSRPMAFLFENVEGFLTGVNGQYVHDLLEPVIEAGYRVHVRKINAANYGVPQHRKRVIAIGGLGWTPSFPDASHSAFGAPGAHLAGRHLPKTPTIAAALAGLPPAANRKSNSDSNDHMFAPLNDDDLARAKLLKPGQTMRDLPDELRHESFKRRAFRRVMDGTPSDRRGGAPAGLRRLYADEPSKAITGGALNEFLHPSEDRPLTPRECARLQSFPDDFKFVGSPRDIVQLIGNAVPPMLAERLATSLKADLLTANCQIQRGALVSFVPTLSNGMSPALRKVVERTTRRFNLFPQESQSLLEWR